MERLRVDAFDLYELVQEGRQNIDEAIGALEVRSPRLRLRKKKPEQRPRPVPARRSAKRTSAVLRSQIASSVARIQRCRLLGASSATSPR